MTLQEFLKALDGLVDDGALRFPVLMEDEKGNLHSVKRVYVERNFEGSHVGVEFSR